jgi:hypothetical protein
MLCKYLSAFLAQNPGIQTPVPHPQKNPSERVVRQLRKYIVTKNKQIDKKI